jgi:hypothetical protein
MSEPKRTLAGCELLTQLKEALGIPYAVRRISLDVCAGQVPKLIVESFVKEGMSDEISRLIRECEIKVRSTETVPIPMD